MPLHTKDIIVRLRFLFELVKPLRQKLVLPRLQVEEDDPLGFLAPGGLLTVGGKKDAVGDVWGVQGTDDLVVDGIVNREAFWTGRDNDEKSSLAIPRIIPYGKRIAFFCSQIPQDTFFSSRHCQIGSRGRERKSINNIGL